MRRAFGHAASLPGLALSGGLLAACCLLVACGLLAAPGTARAEVLVLRDGGRVQTRGTWEQRGKLVVFRLADGTLASLRQEAVDFEASARANTPKGQVAPAPGGSSTAAPVRVLSEADFAKSTAAQPAADPEAGAESAVMETAPAREATEEAGADSAKPPDLAPRVGAPTGVADLKVLDWRRQETRPVISEDGGVVNSLTISGTLANVGADQLMEVHLTVQLFAADGALLQATAAALANPALAPGARTTFSASFPGLVNFVGLRFVIDREKLSRIASRPQASP